MPFLDALCPPIKFKKRFSEFFLENAKKYPCDQALHQKINRLQKPSEGFLCSTVVLRNRFYTPKTNKSPWHDIIITNERPMLLYIPSDSFEVVVQSILPHISIVFPHVPSPRGVSLSHQRLLYSCPVHTDHGCLYREYRP